MQKFLKLLPLALLLVNCSTSDDSDSEQNQQTLEKSIVGVWSIVKMEIEYRCDNGALLDEGFDPDVVDNIGDIEFTLEGNYHNLDDNGEVRDVEDMNGQYEIEGDIVTFFYTVNGSPRTSPVRILITEAGDLEFHMIDYCETHADLGIYYADLYIKVD